MRRHLLALAPLFIATLPLPAMAQIVDGSGIEPATVGNSATRPIGFATTAPAGGALVIAMSSAKLPDGALDAASAAAVDAAIASAKYEGKDGSTLSLRGIGGYARILLVGTGSDITEKSMRNLGGKAAQDLRSEKVPVSIIGAGNADAAVAIALGYALGQYRFDRYKTVGKEALPTDAVAIVTADTNAAEAMWKRRYNALAEAVTLSRDLSAEPANVIYPESFVSEVRKAFGSTRNVKIEVLDEPAMRKLNMGSLVGVGQGSRRPSQLLLVTYTGAGDDAPLAFVGKGITFDSGGISLKPGAGMWEMKSDMSGAASAIGAVLSLAKSGAAVNVIGVAALAENMPGGNAQRPGDVVRTMSGKTIEILNTDAEGRLVLADANEYVATKKPAAIINMATLTGAIVTALNDEYAGLFARDEKLGAALLAAGTTSGEEVWRMPLHKNYVEDMKSDIADIKNVVEGGGPGAGLGATFIGYFVDEKMPWAHIDIAGVNWADRGDALTPRGASGFGVRLLDQLARDWFTK
jgi:leucyl aminopeptidase